MTHEHHIIPRHEWKRRFGNLHGFNAIDNRVVLTIEQHAQAHQLLHELHGTHEDYVAWKVLSGQMTITDGREKIRRERIREYQNLPEVKKKTSLRIKGRIPWNKGITTNTDHLIPYRFSGVPWNKGIPMPEETKEKCRIAALNMCNSGRFTNGHKPYFVKHTPETKEKMRMAALKREAQKRLNRSEI